MKSLKILIIDDDLIVQALLHTKIMKHYEATGVQGVFVDCVGKVEEAHLIMEQMARRRDYYDLVFLDLTLEHSHDGLNLIPVIKGMFKKSLIVVITSENSEDLLIKTDNLGASGYIIKPLSSRTKKIHEILDRMVLLKKLEEEMLGKREY